MERFIPTHVGVTVEYMVIRLIRAVHPHSCGGYVVIPLYVL